MREEMVKLQRGCLFTPWKSKVSSILYDCWNLNVFLWRLEHCVFAKYSKEKLRWSFAKGFFFSFLEQMTLENEGKKSVIFVGEDSKPFRDAISMLQKLAARGNFDQVYICASASL